MSTTAHNVNLHALLFTACWVIKHAGTPLIANHTVCTGLGRVRCGISAFRLLEHTATKHAFAHLVKKIISKQLHHQNCKTSAVAAMICRECFTGCAHTFQSTDFLLKIDLMISSHAHAPGRNGQRRWGICTHQLLCTRSLKDEIRRKR